MTEKLVQLGFEVPGLRPLRVVGGGDDEVKSEAVPVKKRGPKTTKEEREEMHKNKGVRKRAWSSWTDGY